jgi:hypothetical protein
LRDQERSRDQDRLRERDRIHTPAAAPAAK